MLSGMEGEKIVLVLHEALKPRVLSQRLFRQSPGAPVAREMGCPFALGLSFQDNPILKG